VLEASEKVMRGDVAETTVGLPAPPPEGPVDRVLRNGTMTVVAQGLNAAFNVVVVFVLARSLGKEGFGQFYALFALIMVVQLLAEASLSTVLTCRLAQEPGQWQKIVAEATGLFAVVVAASALVFLGLGGVWAWVRGEPALFSAFAAAGVACAAIQVERFCTGVLRASERFGYENLGRILQGVVFASLIIGLAGLGRTSLVTAVVALAVSHILAAGVLLGSLRHCLRSAGWRLSVRITRSWLAEAIPLGLGDVVRGLTWQLDTVLLGVLQPPAAVAIYNVAYRPLGPLNWLPRIILVAAFPAFARLAAGDRSGLSRALAASIRLLWVISLPLAVAIFACAEPLITLLAGPDYVDAVLPLRILIWISTLSFLSMQFRFVFTAVGRQKLFARLAVAVFGLEAAIELALIPWWGYFGACAGSLVGELLFTVAGLAVCSRLGDCTIEWGALARAALAGAVMGAVLWPARSLSVPLLALAVPLATGLYAALCLALGALRPQELRRLYEALTGRFRSSPAPAAFRPSRAGAVGACVASPQVLCQESSLLQGSPMGGPPGCDRAGQGDC